MLLLLQQLLSSMRHERMLQLRRRSIGLGCNGSRLDVSLELGLRLAVGGMLLRIGLCLGKATLACSVRVGGEALACTVHHWVGVLCTVRLLLLLRSVLLLLVGSSSSSSSGGVLLVLLLVRHADPDRVDSQPGKRAKCALVAWLVVVVVQNSVVGHCQRHRPAPTHVRPAEQLAQDSLAAPCSTQSHSALQATPHSTSLCALGSTGLVR